MRVLVCHNTYQNPGGEDAVMKSEVQLLRDRGHEVRVYERSNLEIDGYNLWNKIVSALNLGFSRRSYREIKEIIKEFKPDVVHCHNIFFMITPAVYQACRDMNVPVVQSQHNFRLMCSNALFFRDNKVCEDCSKTSLWTGVWHRCYKKSFLMTTLAVRAISDHWRKGTWKNMVDKYITASEFGRQKLIKAGIAEKKIVVKPNFVYQETSPEQINPGGHALFIGRLSPEKGVETLLKAWKNVSQLSLKIIGDGPIAGELKDYVKNEKIQNVEFLGYVDKAEYVRNMKEARFLVVPSICYENFPRVIAEAFSFGVPVLASRLGSMEEIVENEQTGLLFKPGDAEDLAQKVTHLIHHPGQLYVMRAKAFQEFSAKYSANKNYQFLMEIYHQVLKHA